MLSGSENYRRTIEFEGPEYVPCVLGSGWVDPEWMWEKDPRKLELIYHLRSRLPDDLVRVEVNLNQIEPVEKEGIRTWVDEWGTGWIDIGAGRHGQSYPLADGYHLLDTYTFPDPHHPERKAIMDQKLSNQGDRYSYANVFLTLFERFWLLRGFENALIDPYQDPENFARLRDRILEFQLGMVDEWTDRGASAIFFSDDWASQTSLLIRPSDWRKFYKPSYKVLFDHVHQRGAHVWMHMCGNVLSIIPDLIELGMDVLNPIQPQAMDIHHLAREFGGKVCFFGGVDVQGTMVFGKPEDVKREVNTLVETLGRFNGGYIGGVSQTVMPDTPLDNVIAMYEAFLDLQ